MADNFVVTSDATQQLQEMLHGLVGRILLMYQYDLQYKAGILVQYPTEDIRGDCRHYMQQFVGVKSSYQLEEQVFQSCLVKAYKGLISPIKHSEPQVVLERHLALLVCFEAGVPLPKRRILHAAIWLPGTGSELIARHLTMYAPEIWDDVWRIVHADTGFL